MSFTTGSDYADSIFSNVAQTFINNTLSRNGLISTGPAPAGNQSPAQIAAGKTGSLPTPSSANNTGVFNSLGLGGFNGNKTIYYVAGAVLIVAIVLAVRK